MNGNKRLALLVAAAFTTGAAPADEIGFSAEMVKRLQAGWWPAAQRV